MWKGIRRGLGGVLTLLLALGGLEIGATAALADDPAEPLPVVEMSNGGKTEVTSYDDIIEYQARISVPPGVAVATGARMVIQLPEDVTVTGYDKTATAAMETAPTFDVSQRQFTVVWKAMVPGGLYTFPFVATPSASANAQSTFIVQATATGTTEAGTDFEVTAASAEITPSGAFDQELVQPGDWVLPKKLAHARLPGPNSNGIFTATKEGPPGGGSFNDMRWRVKLDAPGANLPVRAINYMQTRDADHMTVVESSDVQRVVSHGPMNYTGADTFIGRYGFKNIASLDPGVYSAPVELYDVRADGTEVIVATTVLELTVKQPEQTNINVHASMTREEAKPGDLVRFQVNGSYRSVDPLKELRYVLSVPENATPESFASSRAEGAFFATKVEYTTDGEQWVELPQSGSGGTWSFTHLSNRDRITAIRYTAKDAIRVYGSQRNTFTLRVDPGAQPGDTVTVGVDKVTFIDPVGGDTVQKPKVDRSAKVVSDYTDSPALGAVHAIEEPIKNGFGQSYYNGEKIRQDFRINAGSSAPVQDPYLFVLVPRGMTAAPVENRNGSPAPDWGGVLSVVENGTATSARSNFVLSTLGVPEQADVRESLTLSDGSRLYLWKASDVGLTGSQAAKVGGMEMMISDLEFSLHAMQQGTHTVHVGMGSALHDEFTLNTAHTTDGFAEGNLSTPSALGDFASVSAEVSDALRKSGIETDHFVSKALSFSVPGADSIAVDSAIQGSEDDAPITGNGIATTKLGAATNYAITVTNTGTYAYDNFQFIDVFPYLDDTYTLTTQSRGSKYDLGVAGRPVVTLNGRQVDAEVQVSDSTHPPRFDAAGDPVPNPGSTWESIAGGTEGAKALRVTLGAGVKFEPKATIGVEFIATVPLSAPRDGSIANNSIAYRLERPGFTAGLEANAGGVRVPAPASNVELSGRMLDGSGEGLNGGVEMQLFALKNGKPVDTGQRSLPATSGTERGVWGFVGIDDVTTYKVKPVPLNDNFTINPGQLDSDGYLKYAYRGAASDAANAPEVVSGFDGASEFALGDAAGFHALWVKDLRLQVTATTDIAGDVVFADTDGAIVAGADKYVQGWAVTARAAGTASGAKTTTGANGAFTFSGLELANGKHTVAFSDPQQRGLAFSAEHQPDEFDPATGVWTIDHLTPGTGVEGLRVRITDEKAPSITRAPQPNAVWNPTRVTVSAKDAETEVTGFSWTLTGPGGYAQHGTSATGTIELPKLADDGVYTFTVRAVDLAGNLSSVESTKVQVDRTAPTLTAAKQVVESTEANPVTTPTTPAGWIDLFGVTASDAGSGMPTTGALGISVDAGDVQDGAGTFVVKFSARDIAGNVHEALEVTYKVSYVGAPTVAVAKTTATHEIEAIDGGAGFAALSEAELVRLFGVTAAPAHPTAPVSRIDVEGYDNVQWGRPGDYTLKFRGVDSLGTASAARSVKLTVQDTTAPALALGTANVTFVKGGEQISHSDAAAWIATFQATATDSGVGLADPAITVDASRVRYDAAGTYDVVFTATDAAGNARHMIGKYTVRFAGDPVVSFSESTSVHHELGERPLASSTSAWVALFGVTAKTAPGTTLATLRADDSAVRWDVEGSYRVTFTAVDSMGNAATATATVVVADTTAPVVKLDATERTHAMSAPDPAWTGREWAKFFGATATDGNGAGVDSASWDVVTQVNWGVPGSYRVQLTVADAARTPNVSTPVNATITIQAPPTDVTHTMRVPQNEGFVADPLGISHTTGTLVPLTAANIGTPSAGGTAVVQQGKLLYTPKPGFFGAEEVTVTVTDDLGQTGTVTYVFTVVQAPGLQHGVTLGYRTVLDTTLTISDAARLPGLHGEQLTLVGLDTPSGFTGNLQRVGGDIVFTTPEARWAGVQHFTFAVRDDVGQRADIPVTIEVVAPVMQPSEQAGYGGDSVDLTIENLVPAATYALELHSTPLTLTKVTADAQGAATVRAVIPAQATPGQHHIVLLNSSGQERATVSYTVLSDATSGGGASGGPGSSATGASPDGAAGNGDRAGGGALSASGGSPSVIAGAVGLGLLLLLLAAVAFAAARRRARRTE